MTVNPDQAIFDAICAAVRDNIINVQVFIEVFNGHRDRALCTSIDGYEVMHLKAMLANEHQKTVPVEERNRIAQEPDGADGVAVYERGFKDGVFVGREMPATAQTPGRIEQLEAALKWIADIADKQYEQDHKLRSEGARTLKRISDRAREKI